MSAPGPMTLLSSFPTLIQEQISSVDKKKKKKKNNNINKSQ